ncbi:MAG: carboxyl transferase domain-containing protein [Acidimicrobiales bacterium]
MPDVEAVAKRHERGGRTARENVADLVDPDTFVEYGALVLAAQRKRRSVQELIEKTPGDGLVGGLARINGDLFPGEEAQCAVASYDYMVLAGTQGHMNHAKKDRLFETAKKLQLPFVMFTEGGGGRPGDTDGTGVAGLDCLAFGLWAELSGLVPTVAINRGYCFAGNAVARVRRCGHRHP